MHRKFIAMIVATAIAITGFSASKARAADPHDILGGLAAIAILGAAIHHYDKKRDRRRAQTVTRHTNPGYVQPGHVRPLPPAVARFDLPSKCLKPMRGYPSNQPLLKPRCLSKHYRHHETLPQSCRISFWNGERRKEAFEPRCLRQHGYRVVNAY